MKRALQCMLFICLTCSQVRGQLPVFRKTLDVGHNANGVIRVIDYQPDLKLMVGFSYNGVYSNSYIQVVDTSGLLIWDKAFGDSMHQMRPRGGLYTSDNHFLIWGLLYPGSSGTNDSSYVAKVTTSGSLLWIRKIKRQIMDICEHGNGGYVMLFQAHPSTQAIVCRTDTALSIQKEEMLYLSEHCTVQNIIPVPGGFAIAAISPLIGGNPTDYDPVIFKIDTSLYLKWCKSYSNVPNTFYNCQILADANGQFYLVGSVTADVPTPNSDSSDIVFMKLDSSGTLLWNHQYNIEMSDQIPFVYHDLHGGFIICCTHGLNPALHIYGQAIFRINASGFVNGITVSNNPVSSGWNADALPLQRGYMGFYSYTDGSQASDFMMSRLDEDGNAGCLDSFLVSTESTLTYTRNILAARDSVLSGGTFIQNIAHEYAGGNWTMMCQSTTGISELGDSPRITIFPNPANNQATIFYKLWSSLKNPEIILFDMTGQIVLREKLIAEQQQLFIGKLIPGIYHLRIYYDGGISEGVAIGRFE